MFSSEPISYVATFDLFDNIQVLSELDEFEEVEWTKNLSVFMLAQTCLESGNGERLRGFNVGNIIWTEGCGLPYYEVSELPPPDPNTVRFRKYPTLRDGMYAYVKLLVRKFRPAVDLANMGRWTEASFRLHDMGYYGADKIRYTNELVSIVEREMPKFNIQETVDPIVARLWRLAEDVEHGSALTGMDVVDKLGER